MLVNTSRRERVKKESGDQDRGREGFRKTDSQTDESNEHLNDPRRRRTPCGFEEAALPQTHSGEGGELVWGSVGSQDATRDTKERECIRASRNPSAYANTHLTQLKSVSILHSSSSLLTDLWLAGTWIDWRLKKCRQICYYHLHMIVRNVVSAVIERLVFCHSYHHHINLSWQTGAFEWVIGTI